MRIAISATVVAALVVVASASAAPMRVTLTTSSRTPAVGEAWRYTLKVTSATGAALRARTKLQLLLGETVVGCWKAGAMVQCFSSSAGDWITFKGKRSGVLRFPAQSVGVKLTFQATVKSQGQTRKLRAPVTVKPA